MLYAYYKCIHFGTLMHDIRFELNAPCTPGRKVPVRVLQNLT